MHLHRRYSSGALSFESMIQVVIPSVSKGHSEIVFMDGYRPYAKNSWFVRPYTTRLASTDDVSCIFT